jgi:predicted signal transduction protein with EAL and GGDEF domain
VQVGLPCGLLDRPELPGNILSALTTSGLAPHLLRFELSEELLGPDKDAYAGALERIAQLGVRFTPSAELAGAIVRLGTAVGMTIGSAEQVVPAELEPVVVGRAA